MPNGVNYFLGLLAGFCGSIRRKNILKAEKVNAMQPMTDFWVGVEWMGVSHFTGSGAPAHQDVANELI